MVITSKLHPQLNIEQLNIEQLNAARVNRLTLGFSTTYNTVGTA